MSVVTNALRNLSSFLQDHQQSFSNGLLVLFTIGGEQIFKSAIKFECPCDHAEAFQYAFVLMAAPAIILFIVGVMVSNLTWRVYHGIWKRPKEEQHRLWKGTSTTIEVLSRALVVPGAWLFVQFMDGNYYACMRSSNPCEKESDEFKGWKRQSEMISWVALGVLVLAAAIAICFVRCCDSMTYLQNRYIKAYMDAELTQFDQISKTETQKLAKENVETFIQAPKLSKKDWDNISVDPDDCISDEADESLMTRLHKWAKNYNRKAPVEAPLHQVITSAGDGVTQGSTVF